MQNILSVIATALVITTNNLNEAMKALEKGYEVLFGGTWEEDTCVGKFIDEDTFVFAWGLEAHSHPMYVVHRENHQAWERLMALLKSGLYDGDNYWNLAHLIQYGWVKTFITSTERYHCGKFYSVGFEPLSSEAMDPAIVAAVGGVDLTQETCDALDIEVIREYGNIDLVTPYMEEASEEWLRYNHDSVVMEEDRLHMVEWEEAYNRVYAKYSTATRGKFSI